MGKNKKRIIENYRRLLNFVENYSNSIRCISITSKSAVEGKSIIAKNTAIILAENGKKTLLIDCNLINISKTKNTNSFSKNGIIGLLSKVNSQEINDIQLKDYVDDTRYKNLSIMKLGTNNLEQYNSVFKIEYLKRVMELLKKNYFYIIVEAPSFENLSYTQIITSASDGCLFVLKAGINELSEGNLIKANIDTIGCKVLGCILNKEKKPTKLFDDEEKSFFNMKYRNEKNKVISNGRINANA